MTLKEKLDALAAASAAKLPAESKEIMKGHTAFLVASGQAERAIKVGDTAPEFSLEGPDGSVSLADLRAKGPVVLTWFRGSW